MPRRFALPRLCALALTLAYLGAPAPLAADTFRAMLGGRVLGTLEYRGGGGDAGTLTTTLDNTPLGVGDGRYEGVSRRVSAGGRRMVQYTSDSRSARESRQISVLLDRGRAIETVVAPASERTALSVPGAVPEGVLDPVAALGRIIGAGDCPSAFRIYDGRRVIQVRPLGSVAEGGGKRCRMTYDVIAGPGHLSPFRFTALKLDLIYQAGSLAQMEVRAGPFTLRLMR